jgi:trigger factor
MNITKQNIDELNAVVTINLTQEDYKDKVESGIKKVQRQASIPGFRPGKVPTGMIKKMYGKSILVDEINKLLNDSIYKYINDNKIEILGNPLPKTNETEINWDTQTEFSFDYELGIAPQLNIEVSDKMSFDYPVVKIDDELVEKQVSDLRRNYGKPSNPEVSEKTDVVYVDIKELAEDGNVNENGVSKSTSIAIDRLKNETAKTKLTGLKKNDIITIASSELYENAIDLGIGLGIDKESAEQFNSNLQITVNNVSRMEDAELNQEFFDKIFGEGKVNGLEDFKAKIKEELSKMYVQDQDKKFMNDVEKTLLENNSPKLPEEFLKRWLLAVNEKPITLEQLNNEFPSYLKAMQWKLIENKIIKDNEIKVENEEVTEEAKKYITFQYARYGQVPTEDEVKKLTSTILSKESEVQKIYENLYYVKLLQLFKEKFQLNHKEISASEL